MAKGKITAIGRKKLCEAHAGDRPLPKIAYMAFGSGGVDDSGAVFDVTGEETELRTELLRKELTGHKYPEPTTCRYRVKVLKEELVGKYISEQGLYDEEGDLVVYKTFLPKGKDADMEFIFDMDEIF